MTDSTILFAQQLDDGRQFRTTANGGFEGLEIRNERTGADGDVTAWGRRYDPAGVAGIVALLGGNADDLDDPVGFLHRLAAAGDLPADQPLDGWLAEHGVGGDPLDVGGT
ncbi:hypothetical protein DVS28_a2105 [Euzebya pacifica]|uniref:Uncharacterized protein n=1 Tax=Euzebya pacifica TaxID=1608957 RepID=A0A346XX41_9ACTN|nr:hypothetical protein [Euzebya pacifica]AXV06788.1 hypothetical protein DVS28_a2105 [Euzebya pacifica]